MRALFIAIMLCSPAIAFADGHTIKGDKARGLTRALKLAGVKATAGKKMWTYKASAIDCHSSDAGDDALESFDCKIDAAKVTGAGAAYLQAAMIAAGMPSQDHMSQSDVTAYALSCVDNQGVTGIDAMFQCTFADAPPSK
jgi:hypothetical protein